MTSSDYLNTASDLRRIAYWLAMGQKEKGPLIDSFWKDISKNHQAIKVLKHFGVYKNPKDILSDSPKREFIAEQVLISGLRLQRMALKQNR